MTSPKAIVIFSGGQDSTTCLIQAIQQYGAANVAAITFTYGQRHILELDYARRIAADWNIQHTILDLNQMHMVTTNALMQTDATIEVGEDNIPNTFVDGRNALFLLYAAIYAKRQGIENIIIGVCETDFSGYPDCRQIFIDSMQQTLRLAMNYPFVIHTPLMYLTKAQTWALADTLGALDYIRHHTHTCYLGVEGGCGECPSCILREKGLQQYLSEQPKDEKI